MKEKALGELNSILELADDKSGESEFGSIEFNISKQDRENRLEKMNKASETCENTANNVIFMSLKSS